MSWDRKVLTIDECGEHFHGKKDLVFDPGLWGLVGFFLVNLFVCFCRGGGQLIVDCQNASSVLVTGSNV